MKPTVIANANASASTGAGPNNAPNGGITIPINHDYHNPQPTQSQHPQYHQTQGQQHYVGGDPHSTAYGSPGNQARVQQQQHYAQPQQPHPQQQQIPAHFQDFDFDPDMGMDMFPRSRIGRMAHDPFADPFGASRKRSSLHDPQFHSDVFSRYFDDDPDFGFPQFNSLGRRRVNNPHQDDDFFNRLPTEFRQYIPEGFGHRRGPATGAAMPGTPGSPSMHPQQQQQQPPPQQMPAHYYQTMPPQSPSKNVCDAAIQTEDPNSGRSEVDHAVNVDNLNQHGLRNTMDMGVKSATENDSAGMRSHSAPPNEPLQQKHVYQQQQQIPVNGQRQTPPVQAQTQQSGRPQFGTQTHPQQKQQTPPPQTPGGSYIRTIPIFVEGRSEPIINNKEIPNQHAAPSATARAYTPPKQQQYPQSPFQFPQPQQQQQQQHRPTPLNTQTQQQPQPQQQTQASGLPPQTPHTVDSINKIQDIQRDVLELMSCVEKFTGTRSDKEYAYLDEMLTRNLLKLDNIDTNGKESIRLARKEAIKCIQASINVLEAKAEENTRAAEGNGVTSASTENPQKSSSGAKVTKDSSQTKVQKSEEPLDANKENPQKSSSDAKVTKDSSQTKMEQPEEPVDANKIQEPIPLPPPEGMVAESKNETSATKGETAENSAVSSEAKSDAENPIVPAETK
ncbi:BAG domain-containing protein starvin isoform X2 [Haematobia irritans]|uniref:BAG domain-containing protein starvin isoform X2 n=1 Tax=Haematobia irritans TaxID=7368 RepID=UPI003F4FA2C5